MRSTCRHELGLLFLIDGAGNEDARSEQLFEEGDGHCQFVSMKFCPLSPFSFSSSCPLFHTLVFLDPSLKGQAAYQDSPLAQSFIRRRERRCDRKRAADIMTALFSDSVLRSLLAFLPSSIGFLSGCIPGCIEFFRTQISSYGPFVSSAALYECVVRARTRIQVNKGNHFFWGIWIFHNCLRLSSYIRQPYFPSVCLKVF